MQGQTGTNSIKLFLPRKKQFVLKFKNATIRQQSMEKELSGLKIGLEIHQQLNTAKLFCSCNSEITEGDPDRIITRYLRAAAGETGEVDIAAKYEMTKRRKFVYHCHDQSTCDVELDEEPIHKINAEALEITMTVANLLKAKPVDNVQVMRKTVVDGSNSSGFQRTALVARNGKIHTSSGAVGISSVCIEEESAKIVEEAHDAAIYNLSRLGIPLVEIATEPDITTYFGAKEVAEHIGMILRSTGKVKRGLGTIRQDLNVSIPQGARVEIKGAQDLKLLPKIAQIEAHRQMKLAEISTELQKREATVDEHIHDVTSHFQHSKSELIKKSLSEGASILAMKLCKFEGLIKIEVQPDRRLGKEFSEYARRAAGVGGAIHSDELPKHGITSEEVTHLKKVLKCAEGDSFIFIADQHDKAKAGLAAIAGRAKQSIQGVPSEVRKANPDGTSHFLRPMPGAARMYPETDIMPITPPSEIKDVQLLSDKQKKLEETGIKPEMAKSLMKTNYAEKIFDYIENYKLEPAFIASVILNTAKEIKTRTGKTVEITETEIEMILENVSLKKIAKESIFEIFAAKASGETFEHALSKFQTMSDDELEKTVIQIISHNKGLSQSALIGKAMERLRGKAEGKKIVELVKKHSEK